MEIYRTESFETGTLSEFMSECGENLKIGDVLRFDMTDGPAAAMAVKQEEDGMIFCFVDCLADEHRLHKPGNYPGWEGCELRGILNGEILDRFPAELREHMAPFENGDLLRIPTEMEMFGENEYGEEEEGVEQFEPIQDRQMGMVLAAKPVCLLGDLGGPCGRGRPREQGGHLARPCGAPAFQDPESIKSAALRAAYGGYQYGRETDPF